MSELVVGLGVGYIIGLPVVLSVRLAVSLLVKVVGGIGASVIVAWLTNNSEISNAFWSAISVAQIHSEMAFGILAGLGAVGLVSLLIRHQAR